MVIKSSFVGRKYNENILYFQIFAQINAKNCQISSYVFDFGGIILQNDGGY